MVVMNPFEALVDLLKKLLETIKIAGDPTEESKILFEMLENALRRGLLGDFIDALLPSGKSLEDVLRSMLIDHGRQQLRAFVLSWVDLQRPVGELLAAVDAVQQAALDEVCQTLYETVGRKMTQPEITTAKLIYGKTFDYDTIYFSDAGVANTVIFGVQDYFNNNPNSRAFVTFKLVNHDLADGPLSDSTMIHELCHVWQYQTVGPIYLIEAIHAQTLGAGYNYGYTNGVNGNGGNVSLQNAIANNPGLTTAEVFALFNREQQASIIEHYYYRKHVLNLPPSDYAAWQPFQNLVYTP